MQFVYFLSFQDNRISLVDYVVSYYLHNVDEVMDVRDCFPMTVNTFEVDKEKSIFEAK